MLLKFYNSKKGKMLIKNKYTRKSKLDELRADYKLVKLSKPSRKRDREMFLIATEILIEENINNKK